MTLVCCAYSELQAKNNNEISTFFTFLPSGLLTASWYSPGTKRDRGAKDKQVIVLPPAFLALPDRHITFQRKPSFRLYSCLWGLLSRQHGQLRCGVAEPVVEKSRADAWISAGGERLIVYYQAEDNAHQHL